MTFEELQMRLRKEYDDFDKEYYDYHIAIVLHYAEALAEKLHADKEVVRLSVLLHDIGNARYPDKMEEHHLTGSEEAQKILSEEGYDNEMINRVRYCIEHHRGSAGDPPAILEGKIVANADAMAHFDTIPWLLKLFLHDGQTVVEATKQVREKLERDWNKKLTLPDAKALVKKKYDAAMLLLVQEPVRK